MKSDALRAALALGIAGILGLEGHPATAQTSSPQAALEIRAVSTRPDTVSGGEVLVDTCFPSTLEPITDPARCQALFPVASNPRLVAGSPLTADRLKCELKPVDRGDYTAPLTDTQLASLRDVFPGGVCDYSRRGVGQRAPQTWLSFPRAGEPVQLARTER